jgi:hypothetical protein
LASVVASCVESVPALVVNETGTCLRTFPFMSRTLAVIVVDPPSAETDAGFAPTLTAPTEADPTAIRSAPVAAVTAPPEVAVMTAVPLEPPD